MAASPDIYKAEIDFKALALQDEDFAKYLKPKSQLNFSDPESVQWGSKIPCSSFNASDSSRALTRALLRRDFDLKLELPDDRLCPPVPNRFNYILFAQRLLDCTQDDYNDKFNPQRRVVGLDIGTGASAIYPLLACRQRSVWLFLATEIDSKSRQYAERNIEINQLDKSIKLIPTASDSSMIVPTDALTPFDHIDILLTNPPFYGSLSELTTLAKQKSRPPNTACTGSPGEMIYSGGEVAFITRIIRESTSPTLRHKIQWYSSMVGKLSSLSEVVECLKREGCNNFAVTEFVQGQKTRRWCVAWSWGTLRPAEAVARGTVAIDKKFLPVRTEMDVPLLAKSLNDSSDKLNTALSRLDLQWIWKTEMMIGVGRSMTGDVWSRAARRKREKQRMDIDRSETEESNRESTEEPQFAFKITLRQTGEGETSMRLRWLQGNDPVVFESFHGWVRRALND